MQTTTGRALAPRERDASRADLAADLRSAGLRVTTPRLSVLQALAEEPHSSADAVLVRVRHDLPDTSVQTVYGVLNALADAGVVRRIVPAGSPALFERRVGDNHHHLVCTGCRSVVDADCPVGTAPCLQPADDHGFAVTEAEMTFWGVCAACRAVETDTAPAPPHRTAPDPST